MSNFKETIIISLGGSMIVPDDIDVEFLKKFKEVVREQLEAGKQLFVIAGGGGTARKYIEALQQVRDNVSSEDLDWMGIYSTRHNARLLRLAWSDMGPIGKVDDIENVKEYDEQLVIGAGWKPGWSSDYPTVMLAKNVGASKMVNLSNIDYVYDDDPKKNPDAKPVKEISWDDYLKIIPDTWEPGLNTPFDPMASKLAQESGIEVVIMNGSNLENLEKYLKGKGFEGTVIKN